MNRPAMQDERSPTQSARSHWLDEKRIIFYSAAILLVVGIFLIGVFTRYHHLVDMTGRPFGADFITFWAASHVGLGPRPQDAYQLALLYQAEKLAIPALKFQFAWFYPPTFYLLILPLSLLPYMAAYFTFIGGTLAFYVAVFRRIMAGRTAMLCLAAFSGLWFNALCGQNAFLTAGLAALALLLLEKRPILAGVCIGLLAIKPHLAVLFPLALLAIGAWRAFVAAGIVTVAFVALGIVVLGTPTIAAFVDGLAFARWAVETGELPWGKMPTIFALTRMLGVPLGIGYALHGLVAAVAAWTVWSSWRHPATLPLRGAMLMSATFLISPYVFDYDMAALAFPIAWFVQDGMRRGWLRFERELLVVMWLLPAFMYDIAKLTSLQIAPLLMVVFLLALWRRSRQLADVPHG
jgi:hypothetical protein